jgi:hypothetical protein
VSGLRDNGTPDRDGKASAPEAGLRWPPELASILPGLAAFAFVVGFGFAYLFFRRIPVADEFDGVVEFGLWKMLLSALVGFAAASSLYCVVWLVDLVRLCPDHWMARLVGRVVVVVFMGVTVFGFLFLIADSADESLDTMLGRQARPLTVVAAILQVPGLVAFLTLRFLASDAAISSEPNLGSLRSIRHLRAELRRLLATFGAFLTLLVIATGMRRRALLAHDADLNVPDALRMKVPAEVVLVYGLLFAVMLGAFYLVAATVIDHRAEQLVESYAPVPDPSDPALSDQAKRRADLAALAGISGSWASFQASVVIAAPLLTALIGVSTSS